PQIVFSADRLAAPWPSCDLALFVEEDLESLRVVCAYDRGLFAAQMLERMVGHLVTLLSAGVSDSSCRLSGLELLTSEERDRQLHTWNATAHPYPHRRVDELVSDQAAARPDAVAAEFEGIRLTYAELDARAN